MSLDSLSFENKNIKLVY